MATSQDVPGDKLNMPQRILSNKRRNNNRRSVNSRVNRKINVASSSSTKVASRSSRRSNNKGNRGKQVALTPVVSEYIRSLHDPFTVRGVRLPSRTPCPTQVKTISGVLTFSTNALGFARVYMNHFNGSINLLADPTHNETILGTQSVILTADPDLATASMTRTVSYGLKLRSLASFSSEAGQIQSYMSGIGNSGTYDNYRDSPFQHIYTKGQVAVVRFIPFDNSLLDLTRVAGQGNFIGTDVSIGFMITGAVSTSYSLQYAMNVEYSSRNNTDLVPHRLVEAGDVETPLHNIFRSGVNPANHLEDFFHKANLLTRIANSAYNGFHAVTNFLEGGNKYITN